MQATFAWENIFATPAHFECRQEIEFNRVVAMAMNEPLLVLGRVRVGCRMGASGSRHSKVSRSWCFWFDLVGGRPVESSVGSAREPDTMNESMQIKKIQFSGPSKYVNTM